MKLPFLILVLVLSFRHGLSQDTTLPSRLFYTVHSTDVLLGIHWQGNARENKMFRYYEAGLAKGRYVSTMEAYTGTAVYASEELYFGPDKTIFGTKLGAWAHWLFDLGMAVVYYTDLHRGNLKIRPEFGGGVGRLRAVVGYNVPTFDNGALKELQKRNVQVSIQLTIGIRKKKIYDQFTNRG